MDELKPSGERILGEHIRLGSTGVILSRAFINVSAFDNLSEFAASLADGVNDIRRCLNLLGAASDEYLEENRRICVREIIQVASNMRTKG